MAKKVDWMVVIIIASLAIAVTALFVAYSAGGECLKNPLKYGVSQISEASESELYCSCTFTDPKYAPFYFNDKNVSLNFLE